MKWTEEETKLLKDKFYCSSRTELYNLFPSRDAKSVSDKLYCLKLNKIYTYNKQYFSNINKDNSYWAGWLAADGCLAERKNKNKYISIQIKPHDLDLLQAFKRDIQYTGPIKLLNRTQQNRNFDYLKLVLNGANQFHQDLINNFNITPRKSLTLQSPPFNSLDLALPYIIGYINGDGCIHSRYRINKTKNNTKYLILSIIGTNDTLKWISNILYGLENQDKYQLPNLINVPNNSLQRLVYSWSRAENILKQLKQISVPHYLNRKWDLVI